jgi:hypothetical protein
MSEVNRYGHSRWFHAEVVTHHNDMSDLWSWKVYDSRLPRTDTNWILSSGGCESQGEAVLHARTSIERQINELRRTPFYRPKQPITLTYSCSECGGSRADEYGALDVFELERDIPEEYSFEVRRIGRVEGDEYVAIGSDGRHSYTVYDRKLDDLFEHYYPLGREG